MKFFQQNSENKAEETLKGPEEEQKSENVQNSEPSQGAPEGPTDVRDAVDIYNKVEEARLQIKTAESTIEEIREMLRPNIPNRRLSVIMDMPPITRRSAEKRRHSLAAAPSSTSMRTIHRAHQRRLSLLHNQEEFPVTPTTTRPNLASTPTLSTSSATKKPPAPPPTSASKSITKSANRSMSLGTLHEVNNNHIKSSVANVIISETTKSHLPKPNPKYAHIQSTIPKTSGLPVKRFSKDIQCSHSKFQVHLRFYNEYSNQSSHSFCSRRLQNLPEKIAELRRLNSRERREAASSTDVSVKSRYLRRLVLTAPASNCQSTRSEQKRNFYPPAWCSVRLEKASERWNGYTRQRRTIFIFVSRCVCLREDAAQRSSTLYARLVCTHCTRAAKSSRIRWADRTSSVCNKILRNIGALAARRGNPQGGQSLQLEKNCDGKLGAYMPIHRISYFASSWMVQYYNYQRQLRKQARGDEHTCATQLAKAKRLNWKQISSFKLSK
ncbi:unnamed protein product [Trichogramma brassicae]|uniref:Uncharacterized protein n=1 Tax=Trichogramma brassicae TaxID=86971 RepID=A0A6H5HTW7_9HYME|nr:unnamed protein product [Trichogramma brassicae]